MYREDYKRNEKVYNTHNTKIRITNINHRPCNYMYVYLQTVKPRKPHYLELYEAKRKVRGIRGFEILSRY